MSLFSLSECIYLRATKVMARKWCFVNMKYNFMMSKSNLISISDYKMAFYLGDWLIELLKSGQLCTCVWLPKHQWFKSFGNVSGILQENRKLNSSLTLIRFTIITEGFDLSKKRICYLIVMIFFNDFEKIMKLIANLSVSVPGQFNGLRPPYLLNGNVVMRLYDMRAIFVACSCGRLGGPCGWLIQFLAARVNHSGFVLGFICCLQIPPRERERGSWSCS